MRNRRIIPVSTLLSYVKQQLDKDIVLHGVLVEGEVSNYRKPSSGHIYFSLKDAQSSISCVMFRSYASNTIPFKNGDKVIVRGDVSVYIADGKTQIIVNALKQSGTGDLYVQFEQLKKKLYNEGLFDERNKKELPLYPMSIGIITGKETAAFHDVLITLQNRWPVASIKTYVVPCQGLTAAPHIIEGLKKADKQGHDVLLLVRGGGSLEDLWCFNDENLARCIFQLKTPIVTGVGHDTDTTLVDYVADKASNTPTGAVVTSTPDIQEIRALVYKYEDTLRHYLQNKLSAEKTRLDHYRSSFTKTSFLKIVDAKQMHIDYLEERLRKSIYNVSSNRQTLQDISYRLERVILDKTTSERNHLKSIQNTYVSLMKQSLMRYESHLKELSKDLQFSTINSIQSKKNAFQKQTALLDAYSPLKVLSRGYSIVCDENNKNIYDADAVEIGSNLNITLAKGKIIAEVKDKIKE